MVNIAQNIRRLILEKGPVSPSMVYRELKGRVSYTSVTRMFHVLRELGLIELVEERPSPKGAPIPERLYGIVEGREDDPCWDYPWYCYWDMKGRQDLIPLTYRATGYFPWRRGGRR